METEKPILTEVLDTSMNSQDESEGEKTSLNAFLGRKELDLERWVGESEKDYRERLVNIYVTQVSLIREYKIELEIDEIKEEKELEEMIKKIKCANIESMRDVDYVVSDLLIRGRKKDTDNVKQTISEKQQEVISYLVNYPNVHSRKIREKVKDLDSLT